MAITLEQAKGLRHGDVLHHNTNRNGDGTCQRWRVASKVKTWKNDASRVQISIKWGLKTWGLLTEKDLGIVHLASECTRLK